MSHLIDFKGCTLVLILCVCNCLCGCAVVALKEAFWRHGDKPNLVPDPSEEWSYVWEALSSAATRVSKRTRVLKFGVMIVQVASGFRAKVSEEVNLWPFWTLRFVWAKIRRQPHRASVYLKLWIVIQHIPPIVCRETRDLQPLKDAQWPSSHQMFVSLYCFYFFCLFFVLILRLTDVQLPALKVF